MDDNLNDKGYVLPGLGDAGDRYVKDGGELWWRHCHFLVASKRSTIETSCSVSYLGRGIVLLFLLIIGDKIPMESHRL